VLPDKLERGTGKGGRRQEGGGRREEGGGRREEGGGRREVKEGKASQLLCFQNSKGALI
jgi:hypothetical protein